MDRRGLAVATTTLQIGEAVITIYSDDDRTVFHETERGGFERESLAAWASIVKLGKTAIDVGAYTGLYSIAASKLGAFSVAIEPFPNNFVRMSENAKLNGAALTMIHMAASDRTGTAMMHYNPRLSLTSGATIERSEMAGRITVPTIEIDALALTAVAAIKIDVENHECAVIRGARRTIDQNKPMMLIEALDAASRAAVLAMLPDYEAVAILDGRNLFLTPR